MGSPTIAGRHPCPGGCGGHITGLACQSCFYMLPGELRQRITNGDKPIRTAAKLEALTWFENNAVGGVPL